MPKARQPEICSFFDVIRPYLRQIAEMTGGVDGLGLPARSAHHFIELLRGSLSCDPVEVLHLTRLAIDGARGGGCAFDPMAHEKSLPSSRRRWQIIVKLRAPASRSMI
jgi:hypothetical protein